MPTPEVLDPPTRAERVDAAIDAHLIAPLDFDATPRCEWRDDPRAEPCGETATWILILSCGHTFYFCEPHESALAKQLNGECNSWHCAAPFPPRHPAMMRVQYTWRRIDS